MADREVRAPAGLEGSPMEASDPRTPDPIPSAGPVSWWALVPREDVHDPGSPGPSPERLIECHVADLIRWYEEECPAEERPADVPGTARAEVAERVARSVLVHVTSASEVDAVITFRALTSFYTCEAVRLWRLAFPAPSGPDPLAELVARDERETTARRARIAEAAREAEVARG